MVNKIDQIKEAIEKADKLESKLTPLALAVPALSSLRIRALMNNLGSISSRYMENGVHKAGLTCSTICNNSNLLSLTAIDSWASDETNDDKAEPQFDENVAMLKPLDTKLQKIKSDSFAVDPKDIDGPIDLYLYDSDHSEKAQYDALLHYLPCLADEFIWCVDDLDFPEVIHGTERALKDAPVEVLFRKDFKGNDHDNMSYWNGFMVALLKKK